MLFLIPAVLFLFEHCCNIHWNYQTPQQHHLQEQSVWQNMRTNKSNRSGRISITKKKEKLRGRIRWNNDTRKMFLENVQQMHLIRTSLPEKKMWKHIDPKFKKNAEEIFQKIGLSKWSDYSILHTQVTLHDGLPFFHRIPNTTTQKQ